MVSLFKAKCPVRPEEQAWIERSMKWLVNEFGQDAMHGPIVLPTDDFFPGIYQGTADDVRRVIEQIRDRMGVRAGTYLVELADIDDDLADHLPGFRSTSGVAGEYRRERTLGVLSISMRQAVAPMSLVATIAHEFGHHRLIGENRVQPDRLDHEPLTDLACVYFGFGIFVANAAREFGQFSRMTETGPVSGWRAAKLGYLTEPMFGYALAFYAHLRDETDPRWARYLDTNPRAFLKQGLRFLRGL